MQFENLLASCQNTTQRKGARIMDKKWIVLSFSIALLTADISAQTVTGSGTTNTVPVFTGTSVVGNSPISVAGSSVEIGTTVLGGPSPTIPVPGPIVGATPNTGNFTNLTATSTNGVVNAITNAATDVGAQINAAIGTLPSSTGVITLPRSGSYIMTTNVVKPRGVVLDCQNSKITLTSGVYLVIGDTNTGTDNANGGIQNC